MVDDLKKYYNITKANINTIDNNTFGIYISLIDSFVSSFIPPNSKRSFFSSAKKNLIDYISILKSLTKSNSNAVFGNFMLLESLFSKLLNPFNDFEIIQESWKTLLILISVMYNECPLENYKTLFTSLFLTTTDLESHRINLGSKSISISEVFTFEINYFHEFILPQKELAVYFYFWRVFGRSLMPIIIELKSSDDNLSQSLIITTLTYLNKYFVLNTNMFSHIGRIQVGRNEHIYDTILTQNILEFINIILNSFTITHNEENLNLIIDLYIHLFPFVKAKSVFKFDVDSCDESELFNYISGENERISFTLDHFVQCNNFDFVITIIQHLMTILGHISRNHPQYIDLCLICKTLTSRFIFRLPVSRKDEFFPSQITDIIDQSSLCPFFCFFLSVLYEVGHFHKDYNYSIAFLSQHFVDYDIYIYLVCKFTAQITVSSFACLFDIESNTEIKSLLSNPVIYETEKLKTKTLSEIESHVCESIHDFYYLQPSSFDNSDFILDFLNFFGPSVRYLSSCVCCETILELLSIMKKYKKNIYKSQKNFIEKLFHHLLDVYDKTDALLCLPMNYIGNNFLISKESYLKWLSISKKEICVEKPQNISTYKSMYFNLINLFLKGHFYIYKYTNELLSSTLKIISQININHEERNTINSYLFSLITIFKNNIDKNLNSEENKILCSHIQTIIRLFNFELERKSLNLLSFISSDSFIVLIIKTKTYLINHHILDNFISLLTTFFDKSMKLGYEPVCFYNIKIDELKELHKTSPTVFETILCKISCFLKMIIYTNNFRNFIYKLSNFVDPMIIFHFILQISEDEKPQIFETFIRTFSKSIPYSHHDFVDSLILINMKKERQYIFTKKKNEIELFVSNDNFVNKYYINSFIKHENEIIQQEKSKQDALSMCYRYKSLPLLVDSVIKFDDQHLEGFDIYSSNYYFSRLIASCICESDKNEIIHFSVIYNDCSSYDINDLIKKDINDTSINFRFFLKSLGKSIHNDKKNPFHIEGLYDNIKYKALVHPLDISSRDIKTLYDFVIILCEQNKKDINYIKEIKLPKEINVIYLYRMNTGFYKIISHSKENINIKIIPECLIISAEYISTFIIEELVLWNHQPKNQFYESWNDLIH